MKGTKGDETMSTATRRGMLGWLASAPIAAKETAASLVTASGYAGEAAALAGEMAMTGYSVAVPAPMGYYLGVLERPEALALIRAGLAPEWLLREVDQLTTDRARVLHPDTASLRSMSLGARIRMQHRRDREALLAAAGTQHACRAAREAFFGREN